MTDSPAVTRSLAWMICSSVRMALAADLGRELADLVERACALGGELAHLVGDDGESLAVLSGARGFDRRVEREQVGLARDGADGVGDLADALRLLAELHDGRDGHLRHRGDRGHGDERLVGRDRAAPRRALRDVCGVAGLFGVARDGDGARRHPARCLGGVVHATGLSGGGFGDRARRTRNLFRGRGHLLRARRELLGSRRDVGSRRLELGNVRPKARRHLAKGRRELAKLVVGLEGELVAKLAVRDAIGLA